MAAWDGCPRQASCPRAVVDGRVCGLRSAWAPAAWGRGPCLCRELSCAYGLHLPCAQANVAHARLRAARKWPGGGWELRGSDCGSRGRQCHGPHARREGGRAHRAARFARLPRLRDDDGTAALTRTPLDPTPACTAGCARRRHRHSRVGDASLHSRDHGAVWEDHARATGKRGPLRSGRPPQASRCLCGSDDSAGRLPSQKGGRTWEGDVRPWLYRRDELGREIQALCP